MQLDKYILGAGKVYFDPEDANGNLTGEQYIGDTPGFTLSVSGEMLETWSSDGPLAERQVAVQTRITRNGTVVVKNIAMENLAMFVLGDAATHSQTNTPVVDEAITVQQDRYYQLGRTAANPGGVRNVSAVSIQDDTDTTTYVEDTDYTLDAAQGTIYIMPTGSIANDDVLHVDYTPATETRNRVESSNTKTVYGALHFVADNTAGDNRDVYISRVLLRANGDLAFKSREGFMEMPFSMEVQTRTGWPQVVIDDRAVA